ncbi:MAG: EF-hand domain-containing protein [Rhodocyclales bacterium]|nr:EF-hand domain-containing protein [Rhodocyclales bacterium]
MQRPPRPDSSKLAQDLFSQIDTTGKGYIEKSDLASALQQVNSTGSTSSADELFTSLDSDGDGKVTQDEMSSGLKSLMDSLDSQFQSMRMNEAMGGMPPPPPPENDTGFTKEELQSQLDEIGSSDSQRAGLLSSVIENFDTADADGDGKVTFKEAMAFQESSGSSSTGTASTGDGTATGSTTSSSSSDAQLMLQIMKLAQAYGLFGGEEHQSAGVSAVA